MHLVSSPRGLVLVLAALAPAGCASDPNKLYPVQGVIVFADGQPVKELAGGSVTFLPAEEGRGNSSGSIDADGAFILSCKKEGDGAVAGTHRVVIEPPEKEGEDGDAPKRRRPPLKAIIDLATAIQQVTVEPKSNNITLTVKRAAPGKR